MSDIYVTINKRWFNLSTPLEVLVHASFSLKNAYSPVNSMSDIYVTQNYYRQTLLFGLFLKFFRKNSAGWIGNQLYRKSRLISMKAISDRNLINNTVNLEKRL